MQALLKGELEGSDRELLVKVDMWHNAEENTVKVRRDNLAFVRDISYILDKLSASYLQHPLRCAGNCQAV